jgi:hypothetical protein
MPFLIAPVDAFAPSVRVSVMTKSVPSLPTKVIETGQVVGVLVHVRLPLASVVLTSVETAAAGLLWSKSPVSEKNRIYPDWPARIAGEALSKNFTQRKARACRRSGSILRPDGDR